MRTQILVMFLSAALSLSAIEKRQKRERSQPPVSFTPSLLAPAAPCPSETKEDKGEIFAKASAIVWQSKIWGLEFASKSFIPTGLTAGSNATTFDEKLSIPDFAWKMGFKIDLGYQLPYDGWDLNTRWTYYHSNFTSKKKHYESQIAPPGVGIVPLWYYPFFRSLVGANGDPVRYSTAAANWKFHFNSIDLEMGRYFFISRSLPLRIAIGAKGAWSKQHYHADYQNGTTIQFFHIREPSVRNLQLVNSRFAYNQKQWGLGPRASFDSKWPLGKGFALVGNGGYSLLYSFFHTTTEFNDLAVETATLLPGPVVHPLSLHRTEKFHLITPVLEAQMGFSWGCCFGKSSGYAIDALILYEWQYWWTQNHVRRNYTTSAPAVTFDARGDLQMHGLTTTLRFDF